MLEEVICVSNRLFITLETIVPHKVQGVIVRPKKLGFDVRLTCLVNCCIQCLNLGFIADNHGLPASSAFGCVRKRFGRRCNEYHLTGKKTMRAFLRHHGINGTSLNSLECLWCVIIYVLNSRPVSGRQTDNSHYKMQLTRSYFGTPRVVHFELDQIYAPARDQ